MQQNGIIVSSSTIDKIYEIYTFYKNSTKKRASLASALRADGVQLRVDF